LTSILKSGLLPIARRVDQALVQGLLAKTASRAGRGAAEQLAKLSDGGRAPGPPAFGAGRADLATVGNVCASEALHYL
jgi:hypothetical protein